MSTHHKWSSSLVPQPAHVVLCRLCSLVRLLQLLLRLSKLGQVQRGNLLRVLNLLLVSVAKIICRNNVFYLTSIYHPLTFWSFLAACRWARSSSPCSSCSRPTWTASPWCGDPPSAPPCASRQNGPGWSLHENEKILSHLINGAAHTKTYIHIVDMGRMNAHVS
jgi:hypothetical protein